MIVEAAGVTKTFALRRGLFRRPRLVQAVNGVDLAVSERECVGIVGESGSGKSTLGRLLLGLTPPSAGTVRALGHDFAGLPARDWRRLRRDLALVQQNTRAALDPRQTVGAQVAEALAVHEPGLDRSSRQAATSEALAAVGLPESLATRYPHQISGGQRQRVVLARALVLRPRLVVMDEPTSALDVSVQAQAMELIADLRARYGLAYVFITHDLRNLRRIADRIAVMYAGSIVESGPAEAVCSDPVHPYTRALLAAVPTLERRHAESLLSPGEPPDPANLPPGCAFHPRCPLAGPACAVERPALRAGAGGRSVACLRAPGEPGAGAP